jgi:HAD superfamily hydrolase (TIGR01509 family)
MDGTLLDTEVLARACFLQACKDLSWEVDEKVYDQHRVPLKPGIRAVLEQLEVLGISMAVATSSRRTTVETKLALAGIDHHCKGLICGGETPRGKPHADPYLYAVDQLQLTPQRCWAVEDSDNGVRSAVAAGLLVFQIPDELQPTEQVLKLGHNILPSALALLPHLL